MEQNGDHVVSQNNDVSIATTMTQKSAIFAQMQSSQNSGNPSSNSADAISLTINQGLIREICENKGPDKGKFG